MAVYRIEHDTRYVYGAATPTSQHLACLRPREDERQRLLWYRLLVEPEPAEMAGRRDYFGNAVERFTLLRPHRELLVRASSLVEVAPAAPFNAARSSAWEAVQEAFVYKKGRAGRPEAELLFPSPYTVVDEEFRDFASSSFAQGRRLADCALDLMHRIHEEFRFDPHATTVATPVTKVLRDRHGVCQDLAHVMISCLRSFGLPARYVSGYLLTDPPPGQPRLLGADASHAWVSVHCPETGWLDFDPTNDLLPSDRHVVIGVGRDYGDVCPLRGVFVGGAEHRLEIGVSVVPVEADGVEVALHDGRGELPLG